MQRMRLAILIVTLLLTTAFLAGCKGDRTAISTILGRTDEFVNREVVVGGKVTKAYGADLIVAEAGVYQVDDGTGRIWVITKNAVPQEGQTVTLKSTVSSGLKIGGESLGAVLREIERRTR